MRREERPSFDTRVVFHCALAPVVIKTEAKCFGAFMLVHRGKNKKWTGGLGMKVEGAFALLPPRTIILAELVYKFL